MSEGHPNRPTTLNDYLAIIRRRKWIIVALPVIATVSAYAIAHTESARYRASAQILVNTSSLVSAIAQVQNPSLGDPTRYLATVASIAQAPALARRVVSAAGLPGVGPGQFEAASNVTPDANADLLDVSVTWPNAAGAVKLVNAYADQFTRYKTELDTAKIQAALQTLRARIASLRATGATGTPSYQTLLQYQSQLETIGTLLANNTSVLKPAEI